MGVYILRRVLISIPVLFGITVIVFVLINFAPGDPVMGMIDPTQGSFTTELIARERARLGLDQPLPVQYVLWLGRVVRGDLGYSLITHKPVIELIGQRIVPTLKLTFLALLVSVVIGIGIGVLAAVKQYSWIDYLTTFFSFSAVSVPGFFLSLGLIYIFALTLHWLPTSGMRTLGQESSFLDELRYMIMPVAVLGIGSAAPLVRYARSSMLEVLRQEYVTTARGKGLKNSFVIMRHAFPNALIPLITVIGLRLPTLFAGSVIVEEIFHWEGMGRLNIWAVMNSDYTLLMALNMISGILVLLANLLADICYAVADPRIRLE
ncbi:MAG: ABC transporter permease [Chloroflexi bacterium]|nr:ABC transporter permease [Chloroflexota bacterium]